MKKYLLAFLIILTAFGFRNSDFGFLNKAIAQPLYTGIYWILGGVEDPDKVGTEGRRVVMYRTDPANGFADDLVGTVGLSGKADEYRLNACEDARMVIAPGKYKVGIVTSPTDNYGANPVEFDLTGYGFDIVPAKLVLQYGAGIGDPGSQPSHAAPQFEYLKFGNRRYQKELVAKGQEFIVSVTPKIEARVSSTVGLNVSSIAMVLNEGTAAAKAYTIKTANITAQSGPSGSPTELTFTYDFLAEGQEKLPDGAQKMSFKAANAFGETTEIAQVTVAGGPARLIGVPITYPSPVRLRSDRQVSFQYTLSQDLNIDLRVLDVTGQTVKQFVINAREEGGSAGINKVDWDLRTQQGQIISSGIYVFTLINRDDRKLLGKGKLTALGQ